MMVGSCEESRALFTVLLMVGLDRGSTMLTILSLPKDRASRDLFLRIRYRSGRPGGPSLPLSFKFWNYWISL